MAAAKEQGVSRSHSWRILTKTHEEIVRDRVTDAVEDVLFDLFAQLDDLVEDDKATDDEVAKALGWTNLADAWREHIEAAS